MNETAEAALVARLGAVMLADRGRLERLHAAFERAIAQYGYAGRYQGVFPVKCNQQRHVVEQLAESGRRWHFGLEAGSKAELLIALSLVDDPEALLICNGYKDQRYIETAILARRLGRQPVVVIEIGRAHV